MPVLVTNGGPHPADTWAVATAEMICPLDNVIDPQRSIAARKLQIAIAEALEPHHQGVHDAERAGLAANGSDHLKTDFAASDHSGDALAAVLAVTKGTPWEAHFAQADVQKAILDTLENHFNTSAHIERSWHADRNPTDPICAAFRAQHHPA